MNDSKELNNNNFRLYFMAERYVRNQAISKKNKNIIINNIYTEFLKYQNTNKDINTLIENDIFEYTNSKINEVSKPKLLNKILSVVLNISITLIILLLLFSILRLIRIPKSTNNIKGHLLINNGLIINALVIAAFSNFINKLYLKSKNNVQGTLIFLLSVVLLIATNIISFSVFDSLNIPYGNMLINYTSFVIILVFTTMIALISQLLINKD